MSHTPFSGLEWTLNPIHQPLSILSMVDLDYSSSEESSEEGPHVFHKKRVEDQAGSFSVGKAVATVLVAGSLAVGGYLLSQRVRRRGKRKQGKAGRHNKQEAAAEERSKRKRTRAR